MEDDGYRRPYPMPYYGYPYNPYGHPNYGHPIPEPMNGEFEGTHRSTPSHRGGTLPLRSKPPRDRSYDRKRHSSRTRRRRYTYQLLPW